MDKKPADQLLELVKARDLAGMRAILKAHPESVKGPRPVGAAAGGAWKEGLALLKKHGADFNAVWRGYRPLHALIQEAPHAHHGKPEPARLECLKWLLENGADPELDAAWPPSRAILIAAFTGITEYVDILRQAGAKVDGFVHAALGDLKQVEKLVKRDPGFAQARTRERGTTALHCCAASRMRSKHLIEIAHLLLDHGADPNALCDGWNHELDPAYFAAGSRQLDTFELLLERGANSDAALVHAVWQKDPAQLGEIAVRHSAKVDRARDGDKPLLNQMIRWGQLPAVFWLLEQGASPNIADERGWTAVHQAASRGNERMLKAVLAAGGDRSRQDNDHHTPLEVARYMRQLTMVKLLEQA